MNSLMSMRIRCSSESNRNSASALQSSVLPTPVGPRNRNDPYGRFGSARPAREARMDRTRGVLPHPAHTRWCSFSPICSSFSRSPCIILETGMRRGHGKRLRAISSAPTWVRRSVCRCCPSPAFSACLSLGFELRQTAILELGHLVQLALAFATFAISARVRSISSLIWALPLHLCLLSLPHLFQVVVFPLQLERARPRSAAVALCDASSLLPCASPRARS